MPPPFLAASRLESIHDDPGQLLAARLLGLLPCKFFRGQRRWPCGCAFVELFQSELERGWIALQRLLKHLAIGGLFLSHRCRLAVDVCRNEFRGDLGEHVLHHLRLPVLSPSIAHLTGLDLSRLRWAAVADHVRTIAVARAILRHSQIPHRSQLWLCKPRAPCSSELDAPSPRASWSSVRALFVGADPLLPSAKA